MKTDNTAAFLSLILIFSPSAGSMADGPGSSFGESLRLPQTARSLSMGEACVAASEGVSALSGNPAGVYDTRLPTFSFTHTLYAGSLTNDYLAYAQRLGQDSALGVSAFYMFSGAADRTLEDTMGNYAGTDGSYQMYAAIGSLAYSRNIFLSNASGAPTLALGLAMRAFVQQVDVKRWTTFASDIGVRAKFLQSLAFGLTAQNLGKSPDNWSLPVQVALGVGWQTRAVAIETDVPLSQDRGFVMRTGAEYRLYLSNFGLAIRAGYNLDGEVPETSRFGTGVGLRWHGSRVPLGFDYSYLPFGGFGVVHSISFLAAFAPRLP